MSPDVNSRDVRAEQCEPAATRTGPMGPWRRSVPQPSCRPGGSGKSSPAPSGTANAAGSAGADCDATTPGGRCDPPHTNWIAGTMQPVPPPCVATLSAWLPIIRSAGRRVHVLATVQQRPVGRFRKTSLTGFFFDLIEALLKTSLDLICLAGDAGVQVERMIIVAQTSTGSPTRASPSTRFHVSVSRRSWYASSNTKPELGSMATRHGLG